MLWTDELLLFWMNELFRQGLGSLSVVASFARKVRLHLTYVYLIFLVDSFCRELTFKIHDPKYNL
jgi:arginyl-tRNA--protein-N-Asp/Glu arginylyltransferase